MKVNNIIKVFALIVIFTTLGVTLYISLQTDPASVSNTCGKGLKSYMCTDKDGNKKETCIADCPSGKDFCGDPCNKLCFDKDTEVCMNEKTVCNIKKACESNGIFTECCKDNEICLNGKCSDCVSNGGKINKKSDGSEICCDKDDLFCEDQCYNPKDKTCHGNILCLNDQIYIEKDNICCDASRVYKDESGDEKCCNHKLCWNEDTITCCETEGTCNDSSFCISDSFNKVNNDDIKGVCIVSKGNGNDNSIITKKVCQDKNNFSNSSLKLCSSDNDCGDEKCDEIHYRKLPNKCSKDSDCSGLGLQNINPQCYTYSYDHTTKSSKIGSTPVDCSSEPNNKGYIQKGVCGVECDNDQSSIFCRNGETCVQFGSDGAIKGSYCSDNKCTNNGPSYDPERVDLFPSCRQQYQIDYRKDCTYYDQEDSSKTFSVKNTKDQYNNTHWCDFTHTNKETGQIGNLVKFDGKMTTPVQIAGEYSGYGYDEFNDKAFNGTSNSKDPSISTSYLSNMKMFGNTIKHWPAGNVDNNSLRVRSDKELVLSGQCNASDCYNVLNEKGLEFVNYDSENMMCKGRFLCDSSKDGHLLSLDQDVSIDDSRKCIDKSGGNEKWNGMICPANYECRYRKFDNISDGKTKDFTPDSNGGMFYCNYLKSS